MAQTFIAPKAGSPNSHPVNPPNPVNPVSMPLGVDRRASAIYAPNAFRIISSDFGTAVAAGSLPSI
jgi:hypothetical protein